MQVIVYIVALIALASIIYAIFETLTHDKSQTQH